MKKRHTHFKIQNTMTIITSFEKYLPKKLYFHTFHIKKLSTYILYISPHKLTLSQFKQNANEIPGYIEYTIVSNEMNIGWVNSAIPGKGIGTILISLASTIANEIGVEKITLDDDSDNYRKIRNIYTNIGFEYCDDDGPEMEGDTVDIKNKWNIIKKKYIDNQKLIKLDLTNS